ncbi:hypothetical protein ACRE_040300 [Hapsidospora chrysogenum ATCC 11550]|uniref:Uncharacterized protein n=1 Tax=Hapsidospora chrysogenum (strain ATCC 11550 / CBS 779.69 / DSM 880 / IAM 14645 / JCM 23072 / IMI 49137) TaxID=857340 RepID=A0A086T715_HAPC1|nr:hypothetical protein ACRE_040300 [Hapsidospora chrysogenum ATCC 11550]
MKSPSQNMLATFGAVESSPVSRTYFRDFEPIRVFEVRGNALRCAVVDYRLPPHRRYSHIRPQST